MIGVGVVGEAVALGKWCLWEVVRVGERGREKEGCGDRCVSFGSVVGRYGFVGHGGERRLLGKGLVDAGVVVLGVLGWGH